MSTLKLIVSTGILAVGSPEVAADDVTTAGVVTTRGVVTTTGDLATTEALTTTGDVVMHDSRYSVDMRRINI